MTKNFDRPTEDAESATMHRAPPPLRSKRPWLLIGGVLAVISLGTAALWATHRAAPTGSRPQHGQGSEAAPQAITAETIGVGDIRIVLNELGTVTSLADVTVKTQINGQLISVAFQEGQTVKQGDFLAQIDPRPFQVALEQAQGTLAHDQALLAQAQADLKRFETLARQDSIAQQQADDQRFLVGQDQGLVQADQGQIDSAKLNLAYCHIVAPVTGRVGLRQVDPGNYVQTTDANGIVVLTQEQPISVVFSVTEDDLPAIMKRVNAGASLQVEARDRSNTTQLATGTLGSVDNVINTTTGTVNMRAIFPNADEGLFPNQFVNVRVLVDTVHGVVRVPIAAVAQGAPGNYVFVINQDDTVSMRPLKLGPSDGGYAQVLSGLTVGERVVTDGTDRLRDGQKVAVSAPQQSARAPTQLQASEQTRAPQER